MSQGGNYFLILLWNVLVIIPHSIMCGIEKNSLRPLASRLLLTELPIQQNQMGIPSMLQRNCIADGEMSIIQFNLIGNSIVIKTNAIIRKRMFPTCDKMY